MARSKGFCTPPAAPPGAAIEPQPPTSRRQAELQLCQQQLNELLEKYEATLAVQQLMTLDSEGRPRYTYTAAVVGR